MSAGKNMITDRYSSDCEGAVLVGKESGTAARDRSAQAERKPAEKTGARKKSGKSAAKQTGSREPDVQENKAAAKKDSRDAGEQSQSVKTPSVMKLVQDTRQLENQVIAAGKSRIPRQLRGIEPLSKVIRREAAAEKQLEESSSAPMVTRDMTSMVIEAAAPEVLARFNACDCEVCREGLAKLAAEELPARYIRLPEGADIGWEGFTQEEKLLIATVRKSAVTVMIRLMMANKKRSFHD